jgi:endonuclease/exonuclease/phosphatase family metal-dependent hydrolase
MEGDLTVATYNLRHCEGIDGVIDVDRTARALKETGARVIGLQELDDGMSRTDGVSQPAELARRLGLEVAFHPTLEREGGRYGLGLAAAGEIEAHFESLPRRGDEEPRGAIVARTEGVWFVITHLARGPFSRTAQTRALAAMAKGLDGPVVVMGDLNQTAGSLGPLTEAGLAGDGLRHRTILPPPATGLRRLWRLVGLPRPRQIDHVMARGGARVMRSWTLDSDASDHLPLVAEIRLPRGGC